jgi:hypothetical protein
MNGVMSDLLAGRFAGTQTQFAEGFGRRFRIGVFRRMFDMKSHQFKSVAQRRMLIA